ncbi:hypothetical protein [Sulfurospirillum diekertiae]|uniref:hypothetical protein n=1 Tax=Sulfurospirillum diekertiae TaxID=1854492 RepID=UPI00143902F7|nr:hypothetical protein [Sulfurospirillum diekertiae]
MQPRATVMLPKAIVCNHLLLNAIEKLPCATKEPLKGNRENIHTQRHVNGTR